MSEFEAEGFSRRMAALTEEEQVIAARNTKDSIMFAELANRASKREEIIEVVRGIIEKKEGR